MAAASLHLMTALWIVLLLGIAGGAVWQALETRDRARKGAQLRREDLQRAELRRQRAAQREIERLRVETETKELLSRLSQHLRVSKHRVKGLVSESARGSGADGYLAALQALRDRVESGENVLVVTNWQQAEEAARQWMLDNGFADAALTEQGSDGGIDIIAKAKNSAWKRAEAQVKFRTNSRIGRPDIQQLVGAARESEKLFLG